MSDTIFEADSSARSVHIDILRKIKFSRFFSNVAKLRADRARHREKMLGGAKRRGDTCIASLYIHARPLQLFRNGAGRKSRVPSSGRHGADSFRGMSPPENDWHVYIHGAKSDSIVGSNVGVLCSRQMLKPRLNPIKFVIGAGAARRAGESDSRSCPRTLKENRLLAQMLRARDE